MSNSNPAQRHEIIATLSSLWALHPEMRFCQLVQFVAGDGDPFYMEDHQFAKKLTAKYYESEHAEEFGAVEQMVKQQGFDRLFAELVRGDVPRQQMYLNSSLMGGDI